MGGMDYAGSRTCGGPVGPSAQDEKGGEFVDEYGISEHSVLGKVLYDETDRLIRRGNNEGDRYNRNAHSPPA